MPPLVIAGAIAGAGAIGGAAISSHAAGKAADTQATAAEQAANLQHQDAQAALDFQKQQYGNSLQLMEPYYRTGTSSLGELARLMGLPSFGSNFMFPGSAPTMGNGVPDFNGGGVSFGGNADLLARDPFARLAETGSMAPLRDGFTPQGASATFPMPGSTDLPFNAFPTGNGQAITANGSPAITGNPLNGTSGGAMTTADGSTVTANAGPAQTTVPAGGGLPAGFLTQPFTEQFQAPDAITEQNDPGFRARLNIANEMLSNSAAARGNLLSGGFAKELSDYNQNQASAEYGNVYGRAHQAYTDRYNIFKQNQADIFNRYASLAGIGQTSAGQLTSAGENFGNNASNILLTSAGQIGQQLNNAGAARASGFVGGANAIQGGINGISNLAMMAALLRNQGGLTTTGDGSGLFFG